MSKRTKPPENCLRGGCDSIGKCEHCGFDIAENKRRKKIPLVLCKDGLRRKIIPRTEEKKEEKPSEAI